MNENNYRFRILLTVLCILIALCSFTLPPAPKTITIKISDTKSISSNHNHGAKFFEWAGLLFLALSVWIWRRELKLTGFGPLSGEPLTQQSPDDYRRARKETEIEETVLIQDISSASEQMEQEEFSARKQAILELLQNRHAINISLVANELKISTHIAKTLLFILIKEGKVRCDGFPRKSLYTLTSSTENLAIDHIRQIIESDCQIDKERRFFKFKRRYEVDAIFESSKTKFLIEIKFVKSMISANRLDDWFRRMLNVAREFKAERIICYLVLVVFDNVILKPIQKEVMKRLTYDTGEIETRMLVLSKEELEKTAQNQLLH
jgi:hypothetical protein